MGLFSKSDVKDDKEKDTKDTNDNTKKKICCVCPETKVNILFTLMKKKILIKHN